MTVVAALTAANAVRWEKAKLTRAAEFTPVAKRLVAAKPRYVAITTRTGVPWFVIAVIHQRESAQRWDRSIAQGDPWNRKSTHVPKGRGPFASFEDAAFDALMNCAPFAGKWTDWSAGGTMTLLEHYNGLGYFKKGKPSPYIWSGTDQYSRGKYVADGVYDANAVDKQLGCAGLIMAMQKLDRSISFDDHQPETADVHDDDVASDSNAVPAVPADPSYPRAPSGPNSALIIETKKKLDELGYHEFGILDGEWGGRTVAAIAAYKLDRGMTGPADIDDALTAQLNKDIADGWRRPMRDERANATVKDLAPHNETLKQNWWTRLWAKIVAIPAGVGALISGVMDKFPDAKSTYIDPVMDFFVDVPGWLWFVAAAGAAAAIWVGTRKADTTVVKQFQDGRLLR